MTKPEVDPLIIAVGPLLESSGFPRHLQGEVSLEPLRLGALTFAFTHPVQYDVMILGTGEALVVTGSVTGSALTGCTRCLKPFSLKLAAEVDAYLVQEDTKIEGDEDTEIVTGKTIDVRDYLAAALALATPFAPVHAKDCAGICPACGTDLNKGPCDCTPTEIDSAFGVLQGFFDDKG